MLAVTGIPTTESSGSGSVGLQHGWVPRQGAWA